METKSNTEHIKLWRDEKDLSCVHAPRRNLHIDPEFKVRQERERMDSADSSIYFEKQVCYRFSWEHITNHELCYNVESRLLQKNESKMLD